MQYKALITDLDGTAVPVSAHASGSDIDERTCEVVKSALEAGYKITCATGRQWHLASTIVKHLGFVHPSIVEGGTRIIHPVTEEVLWEKYLDDAVTEELFAIFKQETNEGYIITSDQPTRQEFGAVRSLPSRARIVYLLDQPKAAAERITNTINLGFPGRAVAHPTPSWGGSHLEDVHVTHPEATKEHAVKVWQELEGVTQEETIGMGDSGNDIPLLESCGFRVAVGNAINPLKQIADYIAPRQEEGALAHVIEHFLHV